MHFGRRLALLLGLCLSAAVLCAGISAGAEKPCLFAAFPVLPGAEEILLSMEPQAVYLRINVFSGEDSIASGAEWEDPLVRVSLSRPLEEGERVRILADGAGRDGLPFDLEHVITVSRAGALLEALEKPARLLQRLDLAVRNGNPERVPESLPLAEYVLLAPEVRLDEKAGTVRLTGAPRPRSIAFRDKDGKICGCSCTEEADLWLMGSPLGQKKAQAEELTLFFRQPTERSFISVSYIYGVREQPCLEEIILVLPPSGEGGAALTLYIEPAGSRWTWRLFVAGNEPISSLSGIIEQNGGSHFDP